MGTELLALLFDCVVMTLLGATIFFVYRLTKSLENFKQHRQELDSVIANLLSSIDRAERSVQALKLSSAEEAGRMEVLIEQAKSLSDELQIINQAGESMAVRLEKLAETNRKLVQPTHKYQVPDQVPRHKEKISSPVHKRKAAKQDDTSKSYGETLKRVDRKTEPQEEDLPSFMIQDRDYNSGEPANNDDGDFSVEDQDRGSLQSQAERELYEALRSSKKNITDGGS